MNKMRNLWEKTEKKNFKLFQDHFQDWWRFPDAANLKVLMELLKDETDKEDDNVEESSGLADD